MAIFAVSHRALALTLVMLTLVVKETSNVTLPVALPALLLESEPSGPGLLAANVPGIGSTYYALGKLTMVLFTHSLGARFILVVACLLGGVGMLTCTIGSFTALSVGWSCTQFAVAHIWGASVAVFGCWVEPALVGRIIGIGMAVGSDGGGALGSFVFSLLLDAHGWRAPFYLTGVALFSVAVLIALGLFNSPVEAGLAPVELSKSAMAPASPTAHHLAEATLTTATRDFAARGRVWLTLLACGMYACENAAVQIFGAACSAHQPSNLANHRTGRHSQSPALEPTAHRKARRRATAERQLSGLERPPCLADAAARLGASDGEAARVVTAVLLGQLVGGLVGGFAKDALSGRALVRFSFTLKALGLVCISAWLLLDIALSGCAGGGAASSIVSGVACSGAGLWVAQLPPSTLVGVVCSLLLVLQASIEYSWLVMVTAYCVRAGGPKHASSLSGGMDLFSYLARIPFNIALGALVAAGHFAAMLQVLALCSTVGHVAMIAFIIVDEAEALVTRRAGQSGGRSVPIPSHAKAGGAGSLHGSLL